MIIGIDNGLKGGLVAMQRRGGILFYSAMPTVLNSQCDKNEIDIVKVADWVCQFGVEGTDVTLEEPLHAAGSSQSLRSMAMSFGGIRGILMGRGFKVHRMQVGEWQTTMIGRGPKGTSKKRALEASRKLWPEESFILKGCRTPHDGIIDAALIAEYYRTKYAL
jgi:hypothetical protein